MAYFRPSMLPSGNSSDAISDIHHQTIVDLKEKSKDERPLTLFSVDLSHLSPAVQYIVLASGLILFMCLYGYYQELVIYGWFERKLSIFSTFLHFVGCFSFAQLQRNLSAKGKPPNNTGCLAPKSAMSFIPTISLGTAPPRVAICYYMLLIFVRTGAQGMSNLSMTQINYPAKVLFKSASPIVTMIIGIVWFRKTYPMRDYIVVALLVLGLYVFITGDATASPQSTKLGIFYVTISLFGSAGIPMIQEHCMVTYNSSIEDLLYHTFLGSAIASFIASCVTGEFLQGVLFLIRTGSLHAWFIMFAFTVFGFIGTNFSAGLTLQYGSLVNGITNTFRKALTMGLSFLLFPERNTVTHQKILGSVIFFCGLLVRIFSKEGKAHLKDSSQNLLVVDTSGDGNSSISSFEVTGAGLGAHEIDVEAGVLRTERSIIENTSAKRPSLSLHTTYFGNNGSTDFGQTLTIDEDLPLHSSVDDVYVPATTPSASGSREKYEPYFTSNEVRHTSNYSTSLGRSSNGTAYGPSGSSPSKHSGHSGVGNSQGSGMGHSGLGHVGIGHSGGGYSPSRLSGPGASRQSHSASQGGRLPRVGSDHSLDGGMTAEHSREKIEALAV